MKMFKNLPAILATLVLFCMGTMLTACDNDSNKPQAQSQPKDSAPKVGILLYHEDLYISMVGKAMDELLKGKTDVVMLTAGNNQLTQDAQIQTLLDSKVNVLAVNIVNPQTASRVVDLAQKANIPVIFFNREPDLDTLKVYNKAVFVGTTPMDAGIMQGDIIVKLWNEHPEFDRNGDGAFSYVMFMGELDNPEALARTEYSIRRAMDKGVSMRQIGETYVCNWDDALAGKAMQLALATFGDAIELVVANNDAMALGAISSLAERGYNQVGGDKEHFIPVVGVDAVPSAVDAIQTGIMSGTVKQDSDAMAAAVAALVLNALDGKDFLAGTPYAWDDSSVAVRIPYSMYTGE